MTLLFSLQEVRDIIIIGAGSLMILLLFALFILTVVLGLTVKSLLGAIQSLLSEEVTPLVKSGRETVGKIKGTATFASETAVAPIIRVYGIVAGTRRFLGVLGGVAGRRNKRE